MNLITDYPVHYSPEEYKRLKAENRNKVLRRDALRRLESLRRRGRGR